MSVNSDKGDRGLEHASQLMPNERACDFEACAAPATYEIAAQWTIADFGSWFACDAHHSDVVDHLLHRTVDGQRIVDIESYRLGAAS